MSTLPAEIRTAVAEICALLQVAPPRPRAPTHPVVLVVGTPGAGTTCLVNALLDAPGLVADAATPTRVVHAGARHPATAGVGDLPADVPLLEGLSLVDGAGCTTLAEAPAAVLVALDAAAPLGRAELEVIRRWASSVDTVLFALTKIDRHRDWRRVLEADRTVLDAHVPRLARSPVHAVSARLAAAARTATDPDAARLLREASGLAALQSGVQGVVAGRAVMLGEVNGLRALHSALVAGARGARSEATVLRAGDPASERLRTRRAELVEARRVGLRAATLCLRSSVARARLESAHEVTAALRECQGRFRAAVETADARTLRTLPARLEPALTELTATVSDSVHARLERVRARVLGEVLTAREWRTHPGPGPVAPPPVLVVDPVRTRVGGPTDKLLVVAGASGGVGLGKLALTPLALVPALGVVVLPLTLALGAGAAWWMTRTRSHAAERAHLTQWANEVVTATRSTLDQLVAARLIDVEQALATALDDVAAERALRLDAELHDVEADLRRTAADRGARARACDLRAEQLDAGAARAQALLARVAAVRDRASARAPTA